jgi:hypothetical protein
MPTSSAMIETTTSSSMIVKPLPSFRFMADHVLSLARCAPRRASDPPRRQNSRAPSRARIALTA